MLSRRIGQAMFIPIAIRKAFIQAGEPEDEVQELWREVIARAIFDALGYTGQTEEDDHYFSVVDARDWFEREYEDRYLVFELAGVDPYIIREWVLNTKPLTSVKDRGTSPQPSAKKFKVEVKKHRKALACQKSQKPSKLLTKKT